MTSLAQLKQWPDKAVVDSVQGTITKLYDFKEGVGRNHNSTVQHAEFKDATGETIRLTVWDHERLDPILNKEVVLSSNRSNNGRFGGVEVRYDTYNNTTTVELSVSRQGTFQVPAVFQQQTGQPATVTPPAASPVGPEAPRNEAKKEYGAINGQTVGMAVNNACASLTAQGLALDPKAIWAIASLVIRVAMHLERGNLAPLPAAPAEPPAQEPPAAAPAAPAPQPLPPVPNGPAKAVPF